MDKSFQLDEFYLDIPKNGHDISLLSKGEIAACPFPGLRPYKTSEFQLFFGRSGQAYNLLKRLRNNRFLAVIGSSGTGKSSIVRAGLLPQLYGGYLSDSNDHWNVAVCRPGNQPIKNLAFALSSTKSRSTATESIEEEFEVIEPILRENPYGIIEVEKLINDKEKPGANLLVIIDQFEEIFRFKREGAGLENKETSTHFTNLLLNASAQADGSVYIVITMRSEFLGECVQFRNLPEAINQGQYLVPRLKREELKEVITGPIRLTKNGISTILVNRLIDEIGDNMDQLPILQHALMRTYEHWKKSGSADEISYEDYEAIGKMEKTLAKHADEKYNELGDSRNTEEKEPSKSQRIAKIVFQSLTDKSTDDRGIRRPIELNNIYKIAGELDASQEEINEVINHFRGSETSFLMPPINTALFSELFIDISHESLMRNWDLLKKWIAEEVNAGRLYRSLDERRELKERGSYDWIKGGLLEDLLEWKEDYHVSSTWSARYHQQKGTEAELHEKLFKKNIEFLEESKSEQDRLRKEAKDKKREEADRKREELIQQQKQKRTRIIIAAISIVCVLSISLSAWALYEQTKAKDQKEIAEKALYENELKDLSWFIELGDTVRSKYASDNLWKLHRTDTVKEKEVMSSFQMAVEGQNQQRQDMSVALYLATEAKKLNDNNITSEILHSLMEGKIKYEQKIKLNFNSLEQEVKLLAVNNDFEIIIGMTDEFYTVKIDTVNSTFRPLAYSSDRKTVSISEDGFYQMYHRPLENKVIIVDSRLNKPIRQIPLVDSIGYTKYIELNNQLSEIKITADSNSNKSPSYYNSITINDEKRKYYDFNDTVYSARGEVLLKAQQFVGTFYSNKRFFLVNDGIENEITLWGVDGNIIMTLTGHKFPVSKISFTENRILTISESGQVIAWDINLEKINEFKHWESYHRAIKKLDTLNKVFENEKISIASFSPSGQFIATCFGSTMKIRDLSGEVDATLDFANSVTAVKYSPDGKYILTIENPDPQSNSNTPRNGNIKIWSAKSLELKITFTWHTGKSNNASFSADSRWVISGSKDEVFRWPITDVNKLSEADLALGSKYINVDDVFNYFLENGKNKNSNGEFEKAFAVLDKLPEDSPYLMKFLDILGQACEGFVALDVAIACYDKLLSLQPITPREKYDALNMLGLIYNQQGDSAIIKAIKYCDSAVSIAPPESGTAFAHRGFAYLKMGQLNSALIDLEKSKNISPNFEKVYFYLACYYAAKNESELAIKNLNIAYTYGFNRPNWISWIEREESLSSIRDNDDYNALIQRMKENLK